MVASLTDKDAPAEANNGVAMDTTTEQTPAPPADEIVEGAGRDAEDLLDWLENHPPCVGGVPTPR